MKIIFISNYYTHHQSELSTAIADRSDVEFYFIETEPMEEERRNMGWELESKPAYVIDSVFYEKNMELCQKWIDEADIVIHGSAPTALLENRMKNDRITFLYSERIYKKKPPAYKIPIHFFRFRKRYRRRRNLYMLCSSAYTAADFAKTYMFLQHTYKWGYFPKLYSYSEPCGVIDQKKKNSILWVARMITWKHPEAAIAVAKRLKQEGYQFCLYMIGNGELAESLQVKVNEEGLESCVYMLGSMKPAEVRDYMEKSEIFLFTSDRKEGWGAVLNEAMNSACAAVASHAIGAAPFLIQDGQNGFIYQDGNIEELYQKTKWLLDHPAERKQFGEKAYQTISKEWNAKKAADKFIQFCYRVLSGKESPDLYAEGVCSRAEILKDNWYQNEKNH